ncbi:tripartite motif-containing protein 2-like [Ptychodera flava]|uniref:tripartite motif-containing protein 2-like n=1 Tax=Ptychodera flava TaxID=63121 RepID=UPI00396A3602
MAEKVTPAESTADDSLRCPICLELFRDAKLLPCLHSVCEVCLLKLIEKRGVLECPVCGRAVELGEGGVTLLTQSFLVNSLADQTRKREDEGKNRCDGCDEENITHRCVPCAMSLGATCYKAHRRIPQTRHHRVVPIDEYATEQAANPSLQQASVLCGLHPENPVKFYCASCETLVCLGCTVLKHRVPDHDLKCLSEEKKAYVTVVQGHLDQLKVKEDMFENEVLELEKMAGTVPQREETNSKAVKQWAGEVIENVRKEENRLLEETKVDNSAFLKQVDILSDNVKRSVEDIKETRRFLEQLIGYGNDGQILSSRREITARLDDLSKREHQKSDTIKAIKFKANKDYLHGSLGSFEGFGESSRLLKATKRRIERLAATFNGPRGVRIAENSDLYVAERFNHKVQVLDESFSHKVDYTFPSIESAEPWDIAVTSNYTYITDWNNRQVLVCDKDGKLVGTFGKNDFCHPNGICVSERSDIAYVVDCDGNCLHLYKIANATYIPMKTIRRVGFEPTEFCNPFFVTADIFHRILVADCRNNRIRVFDEDGNFLSDMRSHDCSDTSRDDDKDGNISRPKAITSDEKGNVFVYNVQKSIVQQFDPFGRFICTVFRQNEQYSPNPFGLAVDSRNQRLVLADGNINCLSVISL